MQMVLYGVDVPLMGSDANADAVRGHHSERTFWDNVSAPSNLLHPLAMAIMAIQQRKATLADGMRYDVLIGVALATAQGYPFGFQEHCFAKFTVRSEQNMTQEG
jgi:hypothetical protein